MFQRPRCEGWAAAASSVKWSSSVERVSVPLEIYQDFKLPVRLLCYCKIHYCGRPPSLACELPSRCGTLPFVRSQRPLTPSTRLLVFVPPAETPHLSMPGWANLLTGGATLGSTMREALEQQQQVDGVSLVSRLILSSLSIHSFHVYRKWTKALQQHQCLWSPALFSSLLKITPKMLKNGWNPAILFSYFLLISFLQLPRARLKNLEGLDVTPGP